MKCLARSTVLVVAAMFVLASAPDANAQSRTLPPVVPLTQHGSIPRLGFCSYFDGAGERVTQVYYGSHAWNVGLEPGDVIVAVNGIRLWHHGAWYNAMAQAAAHGNVVLAIRDCRTGYIVYHQLYLGWPW